MKARSCPRLLPLFVIAASISTVNLTVPAVAATSQYWNFASTGGGGIWGTGPGDKNWNLTAEAAAGNTTWPDTGNDIAVFQDTFGGTVTVFDPVLTNGICQTGAAYTLDAGTITLVPDSAAAAPFVHVQSGTLTLNTTIAGTHGLLKTGSGTLLLAHANTFTGPTTISAGTLDLTGTLTSPTVAILAGAALRDSAGGLDATTALSNAGTLTNTAPETIATYVSNGGSLTGTGLLTATTATLNDGSAVFATLAATTLTSNGLVAISGTASANAINIASGSLTNTGTLGDSGTALNLTSGATLVGSGTQRYNLLTTAGPGTGTWQGNLTNPTTVAPGGVGATGSLAVTGHFTNAPTATLKLDLGAGVRDLITVANTATFGGTLDLNQLSPIAPFVPVQIVAAGAYAGNFTTLTENLDAAVWFNPATGTVMTLALPPATGDALWGATANQTAVWTSLYDDVIDPGVTNVTALPGGGYNLTSGLADSGNPDLCNALVASFKPGGLNPEVLDRLSPEVYAGFQDYAVHATRSHQRAALDARTLGFIQPPRCSRSGGGKDALPARAAANPWEYFAAVDYFDVETDNSPNRADYGISGFGLIAGARTAISDSVRVGGYVAADNGSVDGTLIDGDASGWSLGLFAKALVHAATHTLITGGLSYGSYTFDGTRGSLIASDGGWARAGAGFRGVASDALEFSVAASSLVYQTERFRLIPAIGLRYVCGDRDGFAEAAGAPASPVALAVGGDAYHSALAELSLRAEADLTAGITAHGMVGFSKGINDDPAVLTARFATGSRPLRATATGLDEDAIFLGLGATWRIRHNIGLGVNWRADFRSDADMENTLGLSTSVQF